jgi:hypothetical protein
MSCHRSSAFLSFAPFSHFGIVEKNVQWFYTCPVDRYPMGENIKEGERNGKN